MNIRELSSELKIVAHGEIKEDDDRLRDHVLYISDWLLKQPHIHARMDPQWLVAFLRGCKHSLERTKEKLDAYYTIRTHLPEIFMNRDPKNLKIKEILKLGFV